MDNWLWYKYISEMILNVYIYLQIFLIHLWYLVIS